MSTKSNTATVINNGSVYVRDWLLDVCEEMEESEKAK